MTAITSDERQEYDRLTGIGLVTTPALALVIAFILRIAVGYADWTLFPPAGDMDVPTVLADVAFIVSLMAAVACLPAGLLLLAMSHVPEKHHWWQDMGTHWY